MPVRRRRSPSSSEPRTYGGTREDSDSGDMATSATGRVTSSIDGLPSNSSGSGNIGVTGTTSTSCRDTEPTTAAAGGGAAAACTVTTPTTPPPSNGPLGAMASPVSSQQSSLHQPRPDAEPLGRSPDETTADVLALRRRVAFRSAMNKIGRRNAGYREQLGMQASRTNLRGYRPPNFSTISASAPPGATTARSPFFDAEPTTTTAGGGFDAATNRENEGSGNSNGNDDPTPQQSFVRSPNPLSEASAIIRERLRHLQQTPPPQPQQQQQQQQQRWIQGSSPQAPRTPTSSPPPPSALNPPNSVDPIRTPSPTTEGTRRNRAVNGPLRRRTIRRNVNPQGGATEASSASVFVPYEQLATTTFRHSEASVTSNPRRSGLIQPTVERPWGTAAAAPAAGANVAGRPWGIAAAQVAGTNVVERPWGAAPATPAAGANVVEGPWGAAPDVPAAGATATAGLRARNRRNAVFLPDGTANRLLHVGERGGGRITAAADGTPTGGGGGGAGAAGEGETAAAARGDVAAAATDTSMPGRSAMATSIHQLHKASVVGDLAAISQFINDGGNLEAQSFCGRTALHYAAFYGHADVARALILAGANVGSRGGGNSTPLHFAAWGGNKRVVRLLLDYGADVEARDTEGNAPQAYSEDDELFAMLVCARRRIFPLPVNALTDALEKNPLVALGAYTVVLVVVVYAVAILFLNWSAGGLGLMAAYPSPSTAPTSGVAFRLSSGFGGRSGAVAAGLGSVVWGNVSPGAFLTALPLVLLVGLAPALVFAIGYKRRTEAYWRSMRDRDGEIVRLRHREQASGGWTPVMQVGTPRGATAAPRVATAGTAGAFSTQPHRNGGVSRGEQAGQAVLERLSQLHAVAAGGVSPVPVGRGPVAGGGGGGGAVHANHQSIRAMQQIHARVRGYQEALMAVRGARESLGNGQPNGGRRCVQVAQ